MRILLISYLFPPVLNPQAILSARLAKYLQKVGHEVVVVAGTDVVIFNSSHGIDKTVARDLAGLAINYIRDRQAKGFLAGFWEKVINHEKHYHWVRESTKIARLLCQKNGIDIIYSLSAPMASNVIGMRLKQKTGIPWVAHFSDPGYLALKIRFKSPLRTYIMYSIEKNIFHHADGITFVNKDTMLRSTTFNPAYREKCVVLPHHFDPDYFTNALQIHRDGNPVRLSYIGSLYSRRNPFDVIRALDKAAVNIGHTGRRLELHLYGAIDPVIQTVLDQKKHPWVMIHGPVSYRDSIEAMIDSDYLVLIDMPDEDNLYTPSKLIDYLAAHRPIIGITSLRSNSARFLTELGYPVFAPGDVEGLTKLFCRLMRDTPLEVTGRHLKAVNHFRADRVVEQLVHFFQERIRRV